MLARKLATLRRVAAEQGAAGVAAAITHHAERVPGYASARRRGHEARIGAEALAVRWRHGSPRLVLSHFGGIGDELLLTGVMRELRLRDYRGVWVLTESADLWRGNGDVDCVLAWDRDHDRWMRRFGWDVVRPYYTRYVADRDLDLPPGQHIITAMCQQAGVVGPITRRPYLALADAEYEAGARAERQIAIQSAGMSARFAMKTKQWFPERYQAVVDALRADFQFVQVGSRSDPKLDGALDLRGQTSLRETAAVMSRSLAFVGQVGMLMHLARAVDCRAVIVYGGREHPAQTGYSGNENLYSPVPCSPCWQLNTCGYDMACMRAITAADVIGAVERQVARAGRPLPVDTDVVTTDGVPTRTLPDGRTMLTITDVFGDAREREAKFARWPAPRASDAPRPAAATSGAYAPGP